MKLIIIVISILISTNLIGQVFPSDKASFNRYIEDTDEFVSIPMTSLYLLEETGFKNKFGWILTDDLAKNNETRMLVIEMEATNVPSGDWDNYTSGSFQLIVEFPKGLNKIQFEELKEDKVHLINNYATRAEFDPSNKMVGTLEMISIDKGSLKLVGSITVTSEKNLITKHEIKFNEYVIREKSYEEFEMEENEKDRIQKEAEQKMFDLMLEISEVKTEFYNSIFSKEKFPNNRLKAKFKRKNQFNFSLNNSYIINHAQISNQSSNDLMELLGGNIFSQVEGDFYLFNLHHFYEGERHVIDDEINFSLLIGIKELLIREEIEINSNSINEAKLAYWEYGPAGYVVESKSYEGKMMITSIEKEVVKGEIEIKFKMSNRKKFEISGEFELPIVEKERFEELDQRIKEIEKNNN